MRDSLLTILRDETTSVEHFRQTAHQLAGLLAAQASALIPQQSKTVKTPLKKIEGKAVSQRVVLIPILRAGIALLPAFTQYFLSAPVGFFGIRRDETTAKPELYYANIPPLNSNDLIFILDPMIATAGSALLAIKYLLDKGADPSKITLVGIISCKEGAQAIKSQYPSLKIIVIAEDPELNSRKFIVPGLGDFGDRYFNNL